MGLFERLFIRTKAVSNPCDDTPPSSSHQTEIHRLAKEYLKCLMDIVKNERGLDRLNARFQEDTLLGAEVLDEALVLYKNEPRRWALQDMSVVILTTMWRKCDDSVTAMRDGTIRPTTTPTLRGGGARSFD